MKSSVIPGKASYCYSSRCSKFCSCPGGLLSVLNTFSCNTGESGEIQATRKQGQAWKTAASQWSSSGPWQNRQASVSQPSPIDSGLLELALLKNKYLLLQDIWVAYQMNSLGRLEGLRTKRLKALQHWARKSCYASNGFSTLFLRLRFLNNFGWKKFGSATQISLHFQE